ncbi:hypothetical protein Bequi_04065 [Brachybacterium sp. JHP9]|uniref:DUF7937 domain-containing protein n=1 Tax=Brachybacterium equifaecis TaxID=2910770 RepID=A0ABT0QY08_9MICO|nr:hypothetical protein [Brachybacterium equifaecis]MCL6422567.1 hypothetical protein [Brachybacterium equifaecis]
MADRSHQARGESEDWIFEADPGTHATEKLPGAEELEALAAARAAAAQEEAEAAAAALERRVIRPARAGRPVGSGPRAIAEQRRAEEEALEREAAAERRAAVSRAIAQEAEEKAAAHREAADRLRAQRPPRADAEAAIATAAEPEAEDAAAPAAPSAPALPPPSYSRSGTTPNAEDAPPGSALPARFAGLGMFDAIRDITALVCLIAALSTTFTVSGVAALEIAGRVGVGIALAALVAVHLLRWIPQKPPLALIRRVRVIGLLPALAVAAGTLATDLVLSIPVLFASLPEPPVGIGVAVSLLLAGALVGIEPRAHEGWVPGEAARARATAALRGIGIGAAVAFLLALVMLVGRIWVTGWAYSLLTFASALVSLLLLAIVIGSALRRDRYWYVFSAAAASGLVLLAIADNSLRLQFAAPASFATHFVYLPFLFAAWGVMISRSFVRSMPLAFQQVDWIVYAMRAFEFSAVMHTAAVLWQVAAAIAATGGAGHGGPVLHIVDALVSACYVVLSLFARRSLLERPANIARSSAVIASVVMLVLGFLDVVVNSLATGAGAGLMTGGVALAVGVAAALMLTVPAPVRDEYGAPDLVLMFEDFRRRNARAIASADLPDISAERARKKGFPER